MKIGPSGGGIRGTFQLCIPWFMSCPGQRETVPITDTLAWNSPCSHEAAGSANELESCLAISPWGTALNLQRAFVTMSRASHFSDLQAQKTCLELVMISKPQSINFQCNGNYGVHLKVSGLWSPQHPYPPYPNSQFSQLPKAAATERSEVVQRSLGIYVHFRTHWPSSTSFMSQDQEGAINIVTTGLEAHSFTGGPCHRGHKQRALWLQRLLAQLSNFRWEMSTNPKHIHNLRCVVNAAFFSP